MENPVMFPAPGERLLRFVGDTVRFTLQGADIPSQNGRALLRTNLGKAATLRKEIISTYSGKRPLSVSFWRDIPMQQQPDGSWMIEMPVTEPGYFKAKAYFVDEAGKQFWPQGGDLGICCHPSSYRTGNTIYCAFTRLFGESKKRRFTRDAVLEAQMKELDGRGFTVIPPSGTFRDLQREIPHIMETLGCKIVHLLPVNPTPTTMAKFGRFGSPYACEDLTAIDPALIDFDHRTTGIEQFCELAGDIHARGGKVFLDIVINHTGWGSTLFENHPEWFLREADGKFTSPGAWGTVWEDLVELNPSFTELWEHLADAFITWCRRGVDGFRCDAGYKVPLPVWQYIEARVRQEFPDTIFLLEGLGGSWEATETLLTDGGMQWAYSELFQNYSGGEVQWYLDYALRQSERVGVYVHYSETHDNVRLAQRGKQWSLLRNRLCALASANGGFGFTCGVEWLADEKVEVHQSRGLNWSAEENIIPELAKLNALLAEHPCFFDGAKLMRLSPDVSPVYALERISAEGRDVVLVLVNTDLDNEQILSLAEKLLPNFVGSNLSNTCDLLGQTLPQINTAEGEINFLIPAGGAFCLSTTTQPVGLSGEEYRRTKAQAAWGVAALSSVLLPEEIGALDSLLLAKLVEADPQKFLGAVSNVKSVGLHKALPDDLFSRLELAAAEFPQVVVWRLEDVRRVTPVPPHHWLLIQQSAPFRATLKIEGGERSRHVESIPVKEGHVVFFAPQKNLTFVENGESKAAELFLELHSKPSQKIKAQLRFLPAKPQYSSTQTNRQITDNALVLLTNGTGGMARLCVDLGRVKSKYDCALGANLHASLPVDRHVFAKRIRVWVNADGFITPLNLQNLASFDRGLPAVWKFKANAGDEREVEIQMTADMLDGKNTTVFQFQNGSSSVKNLKSKTQNSGLKIRLTVRVDIEDRNFHSETKHNEGADFHFRSHCEPLSTKNGFAFAPSAERQLRVFSDSGVYHHEGEWCDNIPHPVEQSRGQTASGDAFSPGWFDLPLNGDEAVSLILTADETDPDSESLQQLVSNREMENKATLNRARLGKNDSFGKQLALAARQFVVQRGIGKTVVAGYPWFLDWGRDTMIAARGLLSAGLVGDVTDLLLTFGRFVENGTMPNTIHGENASNRDTSDAPLWYGVVAEEAALHNEKLYSLPIRDSGKTIADVLREIAVGYLHGTPNGIRVDEASGLVWSPSHFTWMDTNYPAGTPREGYPIEIQVLWIRLLRLLEKLKIAPEKESWKTLAKRAEESLHKFYWIEEFGYFADLLIASVGQSAAEAVRDNALRSNYLLAISFGFMTGEKAQRCVVAALRYLVVPGALRTLAPLPVSPPLRVVSNGQLLNNPEEPYWGHYEGDEDSRRKPAYHNGTAWTWTFPIFCEALAVAWKSSPAAVAAAQAYLGSMEQLMRDNCLGQIPEIIDGDAPHTPRGCDAQAWGVTEALRVWKLLQA